MKKILLDEVLACFANERQVITYFKDQYAVDALKRFVGTGKTVAEVKQSGFAGLLNKPWIKTQLANAGNAQLSAELLDYWWRDDVFYFDLTLDQWGGECRHWQQTTRAGYNLVLQLNFPKSHDHDYAQLPKNYGLQDAYGHPVHSGERHTLAWARIDLSEDLSEALIEEIQTDWLRDAQNSKRYAQRQQRADANKDLHNKRFERYFTQHVQPLISIWDEVILNTALNFLFDNVGVENVYYHDFATGNALKNIRYGLPPRSLYSSLPKRFGFTRNTEAPMFLKHSRQIKRVLENLNQPLFYQMSRS